MQSIICTAQSFNRPMQTDLSRLSVSDNISSPISCPRDMSSEYSKKWSTADRNYEVGDSVLVRKGDGTPFNLPGRVEERVGRYTYDVIINGDKKRYNQRNIKPASDEQVTGNREAMILYDLDEDIENFPSSEPTSSAPRMDSTVYSHTHTTPTETDHATSSVRKRYDLRQRYVDPKLYRV